MNITALSAESLHSSRRGVSGAAPSAAQAAVPTGFRRYIRKCKVGEGSYGKVFLCCDIVKGCTVAVKTSQWSSGEEGLSVSSIREVTLLKEIRHPNVVRLLDLFTEDNRLCIVCEYMERDLRKLLSTRQTPILGRKLKCMTYQLLSALHTCHSRRIVHRDIKPANILVSVDEQTVKLADFGMGRAFGLALQSYTYNIATLLYRAPEVLLGDRFYLPSVDMWSMGCVVAELALHRPLFSGEGEYSQLITIFKVMGTPNEHVWPGVSRLPYYNTEFPQWRPTSLAEAIPALEKDGVALLAAMLRYDPQQRITALQAMQHPFFDDVRDYCEARLQQEQ
ncbi:putative mitochondrial protein kinase [Leptomonas pyrrhocoris]|uniref:cyclin-dependent kinase n=1 Tax=Leptomonas pyrrhocoris TaxID=157538 RepID=A0A0M9G237_LEPPY|nr:putative mitochondrial protein kinase [Leptomonas pyrrhocoris]XP_015659269.1 putative mitochondrial protein kinase [Leptomonas pyrrhocoris]KPA80829.1 putative mitochondrial protein kinase [Leptomonas pyrrhocoris]KPA80830.1 putative mitochondrial protein kinase [Leptomonas pyrrhocoris]|eukprot:XP_015659268.1 putative mitochondrial protein kinase [Leptomonas pyrrhocoris]